MDLHLTEKVVLITGGTDGLGAALADRLVEEGSRVAVCGRDPDRLAASEQRLRDAGGDHLWCRAMSPVWLTLNGSSMRRSSGGDASTAW
jgi:NAD(P)-dependent dehydrogenase (short-subunit alcohol dehydrogenase family)